LFKILGVDASGHNKAFGPGTKPNPRGGNEALEIGRHPAGLAAPFIFLPALRLS
jgi:hypothetical protein